MADYTTDIESKTWFRVVLRTPTNGAEISKAMICAEQEYERHHGRVAEYDDTFEVLTYGDEIVIRFEIPEADAAPQQPENSRTTCAFPSCGHPDHQREQQPERGGEAG